MIYAASFAVAFLLVAAAYALGRRGLAAAEQRADDYRSACNSVSDMFEQRCKTIADLRAELVAAEDQISGWKGAAGRLQARVQQLERRLVKFNHTIDPTAAELALERVRRAREQHDTARAEWVRVKAQETK